MADKLVSNRQFVDERGQYAQQLLREVAPGQYGEVVNVDGVVSVAGSVAARDVWADAIGTTRAYVIGSGRLAVAAGANLRGTITNPAAATRSVTIHAVRAIATSLGWLEFFLAPATGLPATAPRPVLGLHNAAPAAGVEVRVDTDGLTPLGGGTATGVVLGLPGGQTVVLQPFGRILAPGQVLGFNAAFAAAADVAVALYVSES